MDTYEKKYNEALAWMRELYPGLHGATKEDAEHYFPELRESEDEKIRKEIIEVLRFVPSSMWEQAKTNYERCFAYLEKQKDAFENGRQLGIMQEQARQELKWTDEKQKEHPKEELVYRLNGLMQDYIKEGKDEEEKEHRFKCYHLFWDALEDTSYFEQKEQKPADDKAFEEWIDDWWKHNKVNNPDSYDKGDEIQFDEQGFKNFCRGIRNMYAEQKPAEWSEEDEKRIKQLIYDTEAIRAGYEKRKEKLGDEFNNELIKDCDAQIAWLKSLRMPPKQEWNKEDEMYLSQAIETLEHENYSILAEKLKSLRPVKQEWGEEDERKIRQLVALLKSSKEKCMAAFYKDIDECIAWVCDLRPGWKPTEEQMDALAYAIQILDNGLSPKAAKAGKELEHLREQLKKL